ncbi:MAG: UpxY family transcription antiterminator [Bacteroidaceae bacterium]|nr:UpxY family transcription antiterminator [Bacteroidaceae bacterium]
MRDNDVEWFPMRSTYGREQKVKESLDKLGIDNYVPMTYETVEAKGERHKQFVPAVHNLIFVHSSKDTIKALKSNNTLLSSLRFIMKKSILDKDSRAEIITVPMNQMSNFIKATKGHEEDVTYLKNTDRLSNIGQKVRITNGVFFGVEGQIKRIHKNKRVLVCVEGISSVMLNFVPKKILEIIPDGKDCNKPNVL